MDATPVDQPKAPRLKMAKDPERFYGPPVDEQTIENVMVKSADWTNLRLNAVTFDTTDWKTVRFSGVTLTRFRVVDSRLTGCDLSNTDADASSVIRTVIADSKFTGLKMNDSVFDDVVFDGCTGEYAQFQSSEFKRAAFRKCGLSGAYFQGANLQGVRFSGCALAGTDFSGAKLRGADFRDSDITGALFDIAGIRGAIFDASQVFGLVRLLGVSIR